MMRDVPGPDARRPSTAFELTARASGLLLHPTSLPGPHGSGDLGACARRFVDFLAEAGQRWWQMLPVAPTGYGNSPYSAESSFAGNPMLVDLEVLATRGGIDAIALEREAKSLPRERVDFATTRILRERHLRAAFSAHRREGSAGRERFEAFCEASRGWLDDYALFHALKRAHGDVEWTRWDEEYRRRVPAAMSRARARFSDDIDRIKFEQHLFDEQWRGLRRYAHERGVGLVGDVPIFVAHDSADVWQHPELFRLDEDGLPAVVAGVPPDYFSRTGQRWGNPLYRWRRLEQTGYAWWIARMKITLDRFDAVRLDHFVGFHRYWEIPKDEPTAVKGRWMKGPGAGLFRALKRELGALPLIAEDLGAVTPGVKALRDGFRLPGIRVLQFAFGDDPSAPDFLPHNYPRRCVVYTGTHDNDTTMGWFHEAGGERSTRSPEQTQRERAAAMRYLGSDGREIHWAMIRTAFASVARLAMVPVQDLLGLGTEARMNTPGTSAGNWEWRLRDGALTPELAAKLHEMTRTYGRAPALGVL
jgi:4-alpha-glucanotransferase